MKVSKKTIISIIIASLLVGAGAYLFVKQKSSADIMVSGSTIATKKTTVFDIYNTAEIISPKAPVLKSAVRITDPNVNEYDLTIQSRTWKGITWDMLGTLYVPKNVTIKKNNAVINLIENDPNASTTWGQLTAKQGVANLVITQGALPPADTAIHALGVPYIEGQPKDDAVQAYTIDQFMTKQDYTMPYPYVSSSSVKIALNVFKKYLAPQYLGYAPTNYILSGASKRGWAVYLAGITDSSSVSAIFPRGYDNLNLTAQVPLNQYTYGDEYGGKPDVPSPYLPIQPKYSTPGGKLFIQIFDPYTYYRGIHNEQNISVVRGTKKPFAIKGKSNAEYAIPTIGSIRGANDQLWAIDASQWYFKDIASQDKFNITLDNQRHNVVNDKQDKRNGIMNQKTLDTWLGFLDHVTGTNAPLYPSPTLSLIKNKDGSIQVTTTIAPAIGSSTNPKIEVVRLWVAESDSRNFSQSPWVSRDIPQKAGFYITVVKPTKNTAFYTEVQFNDGLRTTYVTSLPKLAMQDGTVTSE